jgi:hypothetical protein
MMDPCVIPYFFSVVKRDPQKCKNTLELKRYDVLAGHLTVAISAINRAFSELHNFTI